MYEYEVSAREIAKTVIARANVRIPKEILPLVEELIVDGTHDGIEFGESIAALPSNQPRPIESYTEGYFACMEDFGLVKDEE
ncbi:MAG TPA: hypothetical protein VFK03_01250 [Candidatus Saccharimonadales bacterium]|nr:hypothetical protein [Candidatus Saccharimonadales bacterium]